METINNMHTTTNESLKERGKLKKYLEGANENMQIWNIWDAVNEIAETKLKIQPTLGNKKILT